MAEGDDEEKTEEPTEKRLSDAFKEGDVPQSQETKVVAGLLAILFIVGLMAPGLMEQTKQSLTPYLARPHEMVSGTPELIQLASSLGFAVFKILALPFTLIVALGVMISLVQSRGFLWVPKKLMPDFGKIGPIRGFKRVFSLNQIMEVAKQILKLVIIGTVIFIILYSHVREYESLPARDLYGILVFVHDQIYWLVVATLFMMLVLAAIDFSFQNWRWKEKLKMTQHQVKEEHKQQEGDPQVKARIRALRTQRARKRMMAAVPTSDVVITNPTHYAVALKYESETMNAPVLVAKGTDFLAKRIREVAEANAVPIVENPPLARALYASVDLDREIPPEHYRPVAEVISYIMRLRGKKTS